MDNYSPIQMIENRFPKDRETDCLRLGCQHNNPDLHLSKSAVRPNLETYQTDKESAQLNPQEKNVQGQRLDMPSDLQLADIGRLGMELV